MRKSKLTDGSPFFGIKIEHFVTKSIFANAIASFMWSEGKEVNANMSKKEALLILKKNLFHQGIQGLYRDHWDGASQEFIAPFDNAYEASIEWIEKNYPYLNK